METPKLVVSKHSTSEVEMTSGSRKSSTTVIPNSERRISTSTSSTLDYSSQKEKRKPSVTNPYIHASPRKLSTNYYTKSGYNDNVEMQPHKARKQTSELQPTYRTEPKKHKRFAPHVVKKIMDEILEEAVEGMDRYEVAKCRSLSVSVCEDIKQKVKLLSYDRYKLICVVHFGSTNGQEMRVASRCLWNQSLDSFASSSIKKGDFYAVALMFGVYKD